MLYDAGDDKDRESFDDEATGDGHKARNPHTVYNNAIEHQIPIEGLESGQSCPLDCGGKLYHFRPSTIFASRSTKQVALTDISMKNSDVIYVVKLLRRSILRTWANIPVIFQNACF